jgi:hypothetical protein
MKIKELVAILKNMPQDFDVSVFYDGAERGSLVGIVLDDSAVLVADWSIYRTGTYRVYNEEKIIWAEREDED